MSGQMAMRAGFDDPVLAGQAAFRALMDAMARPGTITSAGRGLAPPDGLMPAAAAALLATCDFETSLWIAPQVPTEVGTYLRFHAGAPAASEPGRAAFALVDARLGWVQLPEFAQGVAAYPDRSTTIIVQVGSLRDGPSLSIAGPGIARVASMCPSDLPTDFARQWVANRAGFPLGVDLVLVSDDELVALPRSARLMPGEGA